MSVLTESQAALFSRRRFFRWISGISAALGDWFTASFVR